MNTVACSIHVAIILYGTGVRGEDGVAGEEKLVGAPRFHSWAKLASYPGRVGGEKRPGIYRLRMRERFRYISVKL